MDEGHDGLREEETKKNKVPPLIEPIGAVLLPGQTLSQTFGNKKKKKSDRLNVGSSVPSARLPFNGNTGAHGL